MDGLSPSGRPPCPVLHLDPGGGPTPHPEDGMPEYLSLDKKGRLSADGEPGRRYLSDKEGRWRILPASPDLVLLRRQRVDHPAEGVRAVLTGDLGGIGLGELVAFLAQSRWTGVLNVASGGVEKSVFIRQGSVRWATSNLPSDRLGEVVQRLGLVAGDAIERALEKTPPPGARIGQLLLGSGLLDAAGLYKAITHQIQEIFFSVLVMDHGVFSLFNDPVDARFAAQLNLDLNALLMDGLRRIDEMGHFRKRIPDQEAYVVRRGRRPEKLNAQETAVFEQVDGKHTVREIAQASHLPEFDATKALFGLAESGYVAVVAEKPQPGLGGAAPQLNPEVKEIVRVFNTVFREIFEEVGRVAPTVGFRLGTDAFLGADHHGYPDLFHGLKLDDEGMLPEDQVLTHLGGLDPGRAPSPTRFLYEALNELMFFELFQAGELLPPERDEDLSRRVKVIYELLEQ